MSNRIHKEREPPNPFPQPPSIATKKRKPSNDAKYPSMEEIIASIPKSMLVESEEEITLMDTTANFQDFTKEPLDFRADVTKDLGDTFLHTAIQRDEETGAISMLFPEHPCNEAACREYLNALGGCRRICADAFGADFFDGRPGWGVRQRSFRSWFNTWPRFGRLTGIIKEGVRHKWMNCGCDCHWFEQDLPKRTYFAKYECWHCFGKDGRMIVNPQPRPDLKMYDFEDLMDINNKTGTEIHFYGAKKYEFRSIGASRRVHL